MLNAQLNALTAQLQKAEINYKTYAEHVNRILSQAGVSGVGLTTSPGEEAAINAGPGEPIVVGGGQQPTSRASGGPIYPGVVYRTSEVGPELFVSNTAGRMIPAGAAGAAASGGHGGVTNHFHGPVTMGSKRDADRFAHKLSHKLKYGGR